MKTMLRSESGIALPMVLMVMLLISATGAALFSVSAHQNKLTLEANFDLELAYAVEGALAQMKKDVVTNDYDQDGNVWLMANDLPALIPLGMEVPRPTDADPSPYPEFRIGRTNARVWIYRRDNANKFYTFVVRVRLPGLDSAQGRELMIAQEMQAHDSFIRYATFVDEGILNYGTTDVQGEVHSNGSIHYYFGEAVFHDKVSAVSGFKFHGGTGASWGNTDFLDGWDTSADPIKMPDRSDLDLIAGAAGDTPFFIDPLNPFYKDLAPTAANLDASIEFLEGGTISLRVHDNATGAVVYEATTMPPESGVIFVNANIRSIKGKNSGRITVAAGGSIQVTGNLINVDGDGDPAYHLTQNGTPVADAGAVAEPWTEPAFKYEKNTTSWDKPANEPVLGLMAVGDILLDPSAPKNLEIHSSMFSLNGTWTADLSDDAESKGNLRIVGSITTKKPGVRAQGDKGYAMSGGYIYDPELLNNPPPRWMRVETAFFGVRRRL